MDILNSLGIDKTVWIQLACFVVSYIFLSNFVFKPYLKAFHERERRTIGNEDLAARIIDEAHQLHGEYEKKAKALNLEIKNFYEKARAESMHEFDVIVKKARDDAGDLVDEARTKISAEVQRARQSISAEIPVVSSVIASKLVGKELSV